MEVELKAVRCVLVRSNPGIFKARFTPPTQRMTLFASKNSLVPQARDTEKTPSISIWQQDGSAGSEEMTETPEMSAELSACERACGGTLTERELDERFAALIAKYPQWHRPQRVLGMHYLSTNPAKALKYLQNAEVLAEDDPSTKLGLARAYFVLRQYAAAAKKLEQARELLAQPDNEIEELAAELTRRSTDVF